MVVLGDLDYSKRYETRCRLEEIASGAGDNEYSVNVTDVPEWNNRQQVSSSFEHNIASDVVCLTASTPVNIKPDKEMVKPMTNETGVTDETTHLRSSISAAVISF